jgi:DNA-binding GntR family transcriptional regulator
VVIEPLASVPILVDVVYERLMAAIVDCTLLPGQRILQAELATDLGVSRAPVSHALQVLKHQGLLQESGKKGLEVAPIDPKRVRDLYQVRAALDGLAARMAAERSAAGALAKLEADMLRETYGAGVQLGDETSMSKRVQADINFHRAIYQVSGNASIAEALEPLWPHMQRAMVLVLEANKLRKQAWREHRQIMESILAGEPGASAEAAYSHAADAGIHTEDRLRRQQHGTNN